MASFADFYRPPQFNRPWLLGGMQQQENYLTEDTGLALSRLFRNYATRALPGLINAAAAKNASFGGPQQKRQGQLIEDVANQAFDIYQPYRRGVEQLRQRRTLVPIGIDVGRYFGGGG